MVMPFLIQMFPSFPFHFFFFSFATKKKETKQRKRKREGLSSFTIRHYQESFRTDQRDPVL